MLTTPRTLVSTGQCASACSRNAEAAGRPGSATHASGASRGSSVSSAATFWRSYSTSAASTTSNGPLPQQLGRLEPVRQGRGQADAVRVRVPFGERQRLGRPSVASTSAPARCGGDARQREPAAELDDPHASQRRAVELARERHSAAPEHRPVRGDRRPLDGAVVRQLRRVVRLQHPQRPARQLDRPAYELVGHAPTLRGGRPRASAADADLLRRGVEERRVVVDQHVAALDLRDRGGVGHPVAEEAGPALGTEWDRDQRGKVSQAASSPSPVISARMLAAASSAWRDATPAMSRSASPRSPIAKVCSSPATRRCLSTRR